MGDERKMVMDASKPLDASEVGLRPLKFVWQWQWLLWFHLDRTWSDAWFGIEGFCCGEMTKRLSAATSQLTFSGVEYDQEDRGAMIHKFWVFPEWIGVRV